MKTQIQIKDYVRQVLYTNRFAVLATESESQPHASFIAITAMDDLLQLFFATYRNTRKYTNLKHNENVSILFEYKNDTRQEITILTAFGKAKEVEVANSGAILATHLLRHPELKIFLLSSDCALFQVRVEAYQLVMGIDDINWWKNIS
jgi:nitroimidazol reductase NimA-like FMN-containing flavoprotein (pyridoxamine 5'-phosphate oxidase superfamily)